MYMKMKRSFALLGSAMFFVGCFSLYLMLESSNLSAGKTGDFGENDLSSIEAKIKEIEANLKKNHKTISLIKDTVRDIANGDSEGIQKLQAALDADDPGRPFIHISPHKKGAVNVSKTSVLHIPAEMCTLAEMSPTKPDVQMLDLMDVIPFDNLDGGVWKQGFPINYNTNQWSKDKLQVFVIPHSHNDPGWLKTFEKYYFDQTRHILNLMVDKLEAFPQMRFIYAEMSFFNLWWNEISQDVKDRVKRLIESKRLEIVTGGWVMTDEANAHYFAMLDQMIEGNQWLVNEVGVTPRSGWAIDPFGHSPTMAYLLKEMGFENMLIQRIHYSVKKHLANHQLLEFLWRQNWDHQGSTDILCHMMPFYSYDVPHTCGPDPKLCCQYDFKRLPGGRVSCPWKIPPVPITNSNVAQRAELLLDQYRKKSMLYRNNVVLIPLGDDFRYDKATEWDNQFTNYQKLFDYMNQQKDWNVEAKFGTLSDYFDALRARAGSSQDGGHPVDIPVLSGDFYTYSDREDHYWSGYFTSRPFYKRLDRIMEAHLRGAEILYSLAVAHAHHDKVLSFPDNFFMRSLISARRNLGLYQHHDGITGTAKDHVVVDYGVKLLKSITDMKTVIMACSHFLLLADKQRYNPEEPLYFDVDEVRASHDALPVKTVIYLSERPTPVVFYNSLGHTRQTVVRVYVSQSSLVVKDPNGQIIPSQVDPFWKTPDQIASDIFKVVFVATVPAIGLSTYSIQTVPETSDLRDNLPTVTVYNTEKLSSNGPYQVEKKSDDEFSIENVELKATFSTGNGMLKTLKLKESGEQLETQMEFVTYGARTSTKEKSGAYLFLPDGSAKSLSYERPFIRVIQGHILSEVHVSLPYVAQVVRLPTSSGIDSLGMDIQNIVDLHGTRNTELAMRIKTNLQNHNREFFTDLNGFQIQRRRTMDKIPLQANFYPMPTMAYLEDQKTRFSILSGQSLGVASLEQGWLEIMQDRRLNQDDNRGVGQGVMDNKNTPNIFRILVEKRIDESKIPPSQPVGFPSLLSHLMSQELIHPIYILPKKDPADSAALSPYFAPLVQDIPCELHLVNIRTMPRKESNDESTPTEAALILHGLGFDCTFPTKGISCATNNGKIVLEKLFHNVTVTKAQSTTLSLLHEQDEVNVRHNLKVPPMEIKALKITLR